MAGALAQPADLDAGAPARRVAGGVTRAGAGGVVPAAVELDDESLAGNQTSASMKRSSAQSQWLKR